MTNILDDKAIVGLGLMDLAWHSRGTLFHLISKTRDVEFHQRRLKSSTVRVRRLIKRFGGFAYQVKNVAARVTDATGVFFCCVFSLKRVLS